MTIVKKEDGYFEESIVQPDAIVKFTIADIDDQIAGTQKEIDRLQTIIDVLKARKAGAIAAK